MTDDVMTDGLSAINFTRGAGGLKNTEFGQRVFGVCDTGYAKWPCVVQEAHQNGAFVDLVQGRITFFNAGRGQQLRHHFFVLIRALPQVHCGQVKAKDLDGAQQWHEPLCRQILRMMTLQ